MHKTRNPDIIARRFWAKVDISTGQGPRGDCHQWQGAKFQSGYGEAWNGEKYVRAHRRAWELLHGPIPSGMDILHTCDNPSCCRDEHLYVGTPLQNAADREARGRGNHVGGANHPESKKTHCPQGHPYDQANTIRRRGSRECRACKIENQRKSRQRLKRERELCK